MRNAIVLLGAVMCGVFVGCGDYNNGEQVSAAKNESGESRNFGSATDISPSDGKTVDTNNLNVADNGIGGAPQRASGNYQSQTLPGQGSDQELAKQIKVAITTGSMGTTGSIAEDQLTKIDVQVANGVVTLSGPVAGEQEKRTIEKQIAGIRGVKGVVNNLTPGARRLNDKAFEPLVPRSKGNE